MTDKPNVLLYAGIAIIAFCLQAFAIKDARTPPFSDSGIFLQMAEAPLTSQKLLGGQRPPLVPLVYKFLPDSEVWRKWFQFILSFLGWTALSVAATFHVVCVRLRIITFAVIQFFPLTVEILIWHAATLSESIANSMFAATAAGWLVFLHSKQLVALLTAISLTSLWMFTRETNAYVGLVVLLTVTPVWFVSRSRRSLYLVWPILLTTFCLCEVSSNSGKRWLYPFLNVFGTRILMSDSSTAFFLKSGMPEGDLTAFKGLAARLTEKHVISKEYPEVSNWIMGNAKETYAKFLIMHPKYSFGKPIQDTRLLLLPNYDEYTPQGLRVPFKNIIGKLVYPTHPGLFQVWSILALVAFCLGLTFGRGNGLFLIGTSMLAASIPFALLVWHGDSLEIGRHALCVGILFRLGGWFLMIAALDRYTSRRSELRQTPTTLLVVT